MAAILITTLSILAIAGAAWAAKKWLRVPLCPICLGVGGTWLWMLIGRSLGYSVDAAMLSILLGGSVVGIAFQVERRLPQGRSPLLWKTLFIPAGFAAAYALAAAQWSLLILPCPAGCLGRTKQGGRRAEKEDAAVLLRKANV